MTALSHTYLGRYQGHREEMYLLLLLSTLGGMVMVASRHFTSFFIGLELLSMPMYGMAAYLVKERRSLEAGMKYLVLSAVASAFILFGMALDLRPDRDDGVRRHRRAARRAHGRREAS